MTGRWIREYRNSGSIPDLPGKTVGIVGLGEIGRKVARRLADEMAGLWEGKRSRFLVNGELFAEVAARILRRGCAPGCPQARTSPG